MEAPPGVAAHVIVGALGSGLPIDLDDDTAHHLASVLRLRAGEPVGATDGRGGYLPCRYSGKGRLEPAGPPQVVAPRSPALTVGLVPVKGDRPEWAVQKLTELGVDRIVVLQSERSVIRWSAERAGSHLRRLDKIARAAVMQSRQVWLPALEGPIALPTLLGRARAGGTALAQMGGPPPSPGLDTVLVGPEGGWTPAELDAATAAEVGTVGLGSTVMRAETAAMAAGVLMTAIRAGVAEPAGGVERSPL